MKIFDLEQDLLSAWNILDDLKLVEQSEDKEKFIEALQTVYREKFEKLMNTFEETCIEYHGFRTGELEDEITKHSGE